jgi:predicted metalloprotease with PDZ domain
LNSWLLCLTILVCGQGALARPQGQEPSPVAYTVSVSSIPKRLFHITVKVKQPSAPQVTFVMPAWSPGYYQILNFEKNVLHTSAKDEQGKPLPIKLKNERFWQVSVPESTKSLLFEYDLKAEDQGFGFFGSTLRQKLGYINSSSAFMYLEGQKEAKCTLTMNLPTGWQTGTALAPLNSATPSGTQFEAPDYDAFVDCPLQLGKFTTLHFQAGGTPFEAILVGEHRVKPQLVENLTKVVTTTKDMFGGFPFNKFVFIFHCGEGGFFGGLEHRSSTVIHLGEGIGDGGSDDVLPIISHEFFHAWNVKRIRPVGLGPFDYTQPVRSRSVWFAEGVTDYYAQLLLVRAGLRNMTWLTQFMARQISALDVNPARRTVSLEEASQKAWEGGSMGFGGLSYYLKGALVGLYFDIRLRTVTQNRASLDDVLRLLDREFGAMDKGYPEEALLQSLNRVGQADFSQEYNAYVRGTVDIPWQAVFPNAGLLFKREQFGVLGVTFATNVGDEAPAKIVQVLGESPAEKMGIKVGDVIESVQDRAVTAGNVRTVLRSFLPESELALKIRRDAKTLMLKGKTELRYGEASLAPMSAEEATPLAVQIRAGILGRPTTGSLRQI